MKKDTLINWGIISVVFFLILFILASVIFSMKTFSYVADFENQSIIKSYFLTKIRSADAKDSINVIDENTLSFMDDGMETVIYEYNGNIMEQYKFSEDSLDKSSGEILFKNIDISFSKLDRTLTISSQDMSFDIELRCS